MAKVRAAKLHLLTVRETQTAGEGDHSDGGGLLLRVRDASASWVFRFTSPAGRRREMGLGPARRGSSAETSESLTLARKLARDARDRLQQGVDPIQERERRREEAREADAQVHAELRQQQITLARWARHYHERAIESRLSAKHAAQWISSLENHIPPALWNKPIAEITAPELLSTLAGVRSLEVAGERIPEKLRRIQCNACAPRLESPLGRWSLRC